MKSLAFTLASLAIWSTPAAWGFWQADAWGQATQEGSETQPAVEGWHWGMATYRRCATRHAKSLWHPSEVSAWCE
jgi:hypothetical protein